MPNESELEPTVRATLERELGSTCDPVVRTAIQQLLDTWTSAGREPAGCKVLLEASLFATRAHQGQYRRSGEPYVTHPLASASIAAELGLELDVVTAAVLHDIVEDTPVPLATLAILFGETVAGLVDGVTKVSTLKRSNLSRLRGAAGRPAVGEDPAQAAKLRKLVVSLARDRRVVLVKLVDRLHNLRTIEHLPAEKARRVGWETLLVYAPLAGRVGLGAVKAELEDRSFAVADPDSYQRTVGELARAGSLIERLDEAVAEIRMILGDDAEVYARVKSTWSAYRKARRLGVSADQVPDLVGLRVVCRDVDQCYVTLGKLHGAWRPLPGSFDDYIAAPKATTYQSLHTLVLGPGGAPLEIQIRTSAMHEAAERGQAAHHAYKHGHEPGWVTRLLEWETDSGGDLGFVDAVHAELAGDEVFVFTPHGDVIELPFGATLLDFAYALHTDIGDQCAGGTVNGRPASPGTVLRSGDIAVVQRNREAKQPPPPSWLLAARTAKARARVRKLAGRAGERPLERTMFQLVVELEDAPGLLGRVAAAITRGGGTITASRSNVSDGVSRQRFNLEGDPQQVVACITEIPGVRSIALEDVHDEF